MRTQWIFRILRQQWESAETIPDERKEEKNKPEKFSLSKIPGKKCETC